MFHSPGLSRCLVPWGDRHKGPRFPNIPVFDRTALPCIAHKPRFCTGRRCPLESTPLPHPHHRCSGSPKFLPSHLQCPKTSERGDAQHGCFESNERMNEQIIFESGSNIPSASVNPKQRWEPADFSPCHDGWAFRPEIGKLQPLGPSLSSACFCE